MLAKFWREYITQRSYWYTTHRLQHIQDILLDETSNMLKRRTVRTWRNIMISNCTPVCTVSLELRLDLFFNFVERAGQGVQAWKMVHKFSSTDGIASCHGPGSQTYSFIPSSSKLLAVSSLAWQVWHSGVSGSLFLFYFVCCSHHASYKIGTSPPCNWAKHSWWKSAACVRRATHLSPSPLWHWCVSHSNHHRLTRNIPLASTNFEPSPECLLERVP